jgi:hypothetical protein
MKNNVCFLMAVFAALFASAMPTKQELSKARTDVQELMEPVMKEYRAQKKTAVEVADASVKYAKMSNNEAVRFLFLRGAINYYINGGDYKKASDTIEELKKNIKALPPSEIVALLKRAYNQGTLQKSPRLESVFQFAHAQMQAGDDIKKLVVSLKSISSSALRRQYAEALAVCENWNAALTEFAKCDGEVAKIAKVDFSGKGNPLTVGDFWWSYESNYKGGEIVFHNRAAEYYRKAIADGKVDGLKKTLIEQRLASLALPDEDNAVAANTVIKGSKNDQDSASTVGAVKVRTQVVAAKNSSGLLHRWSFTDGLNDSVGNVLPIKSSNAKVENGALALQSGSPIEYPEGTIPLAPFTVQVWASATDKGLGSEGDYIFKIAPSSNNQDDSVFWTWTQRGKKWVSVIGAYESSKKVGHGKMLVNGQKHLYTVTAEKAGGGMMLKFYRDDTIFGELKAPKSWKKPPQLILGGFVSPTYDEVRVYSRVLTHSEIITTVNEGVDKVPEFGKGK